MAKVVSLRDIVDALDAPSQETETFLDRETGEIIYVTEDDQVALEAPDPDDIPEWQRAHLAKLREVLNTDRLVQLPNSYEIHEWSIMERFCGTVADAQARDQLFESIQGRGAFRMFRSTLERFGLREQWYAYRRSAFEEIVEEWLEANNIPHD